jgi:effector-binding domain-containing protein
VIGLQAISHPTSHIRYFHHAEMTMLDDPMIVESEAQKAAVIHLTIPRSRIAEEMGPGFNELMSTLTAQGITPTGPWFSHHLRMDPAVFDFEIGVPVAADVTPSGRVKPGHLPATRVARTVYRGGYEGLGSAWGEFDAWLKSQGHTPAGDLWEVYMAGPETGPDSSKYRTELNRPLKD